ncbi:hypothetical protein V7S43_015937 [Phytophthora oleae]|uniref:Uncharacterized protein n=1 Tax=Phytophthora oleae TaxID=2107226 RepID=A0ABD3EWY9_9STRA
MLLSLREDAGDNSLPESASLPFAAEFVGSKLDVAQSPRSPLEDPLEPLLSPSSSRDSSDSTIDAVVPIDAKERIMTAVSSQHLSEGSRTWFQRAAMTKIENTGEDTALCSRNMALQQSWVMSSRTQKILDAVSSAKTLSTEKMIANDSAKLQEMESVAVYMYTLVQCYKIDEKFRADTCTSPVVDVLSSPRIADAVAKQITSRRTIACPPKRAN